jgi:hypothetical protein
MTAIPAQTTQNKLNQMELDRKFNGTWKADAGKDTTYIIECKSMYSGVETLFKTVTKGKTIFEDKSLLGLDKKTGKMIECSVDNESPYMNVYAVWFTSESVMEEVPIEEVSNLENASFRITFEFKSPDMFVLTYREHAKVTGTYQFHRK